MWRPVRCSTKIQRYNELWMVNQDKNDKCVRPAIRRTSNLFAQIGATIEIQLIKELKWWILVQKIDWNYGTKNPSNKWSLQIKKEISDLYIFLRKNHIIWRRWRQKKKPNLDGRPFNQSDKNSYAVINYIRNWLQSCLFPWCFFFVVRRFFLHYFFFEFSEQEAKN